MIYEVEDNGAHTIKESNSKCGVVCWGWTCALSGREVSVAEMEIK
jgi:hypothetical protein